MPCSRSGPRYLPRRALLAVLAIVPPIVFGCGGGSSSSAPTEKTVAPPPATQGGAASSRARDWTRFGFDAARSNAATLSTAISARDARRLRRIRIKLPGTVDSSPIYLAGVGVRGRRRDVLFMTTSYGRTLAVDASGGRILWTFTPRSSTRLEGSAQITQSTPVADPSRRFVFAASPDGRIHKLTVANGREANAGAWPAVVTRDATHEKLPAALNVSGSSVIATTGGYFGDAPPYQGHVLAIDRRTGRVRQVFNALCSDRHGLILPDTCPESGSAIWARSGAVVQPGSRRLLVTTGNGRFDGRTFWGDSVLQLSPDASRRLGSFTPGNQAELDATDADLGSTAPALLPGGLATQSGKDGVVRVLDLSRLGQGGDAAQIQTLPAPGGDGVFTTAAVLRRSRGATVFYANGSGTTAFALRGRRLSVLWENDTAGTSPVIAGGLVWIYDPTGGGLRVYRPSSASPIATLPAGPGHWNSPIVMARRAALPEGDSNDHRTSGILNIYRLP
jgi:outer membrane protein assembly factor BamB